MTSETPEMEVIMVTARANDLDMEAAPLDPLGLGDTRLRRGQALPQQIKPRKSLLIVVATDKFAEDNKIRPLCRRKKAAGTSFGSSSAIVPW